MACNSTAKEREHDGYIALSVSPKVVEWLQVFRESYSKTNSNVSLVIAVLGSVLNAINLLVLLRPRLRTSGTNTFLAMIATCDLTTMIFFLVFNIRILRANPDLQCLPRYFTYSWAVFLVIYSNLSAIIHSVSLWLAVSLGFARLRVVTLRRPQTLNAWYNAPLKALLPGASLLAVLCVLHIPTMLNYHIESFPSFCPIEITHNATPQIHYLRRNRNLHQRLRCLHGVDIRRMMHYIHGLVDKLLPSVLLCYLSIHIIVVMSRNRMKMHSNRTMGKHPTSSSRKRLLEQRAAERTTFMLVTLITVSGLTEIPQGILSICCVVFGSDFEDTVYYRIGDFIDTLSLLNSATNFVIYCSMSGEFRRCFMETLGMCYIRRKKEVEAIGSSIKKLSTSSRAPTISTLPLSPIPSPIPPASPLSPSPIHFYAKLPQDNHTSDEDEVFL